MKKANTEAFAFQLFIETGIYPSFETNFVNLDFVLAALFLCQLFFLARRSIMLNTTGKNFVASDLSVISRRFLIAVRVDFL